MTMRTFVLLLLCVCGNDTLADAVFDSCILCHGSGVKGNAAIQAPKLAGLQGWYVLRQLEAFRSGVRGTHTQDVSGSEMRTIARSLPEDELKTLATLIAGLPATSNNATIDGDASRGERLYVSCAACHGSRGEGNEALGAPALARGSDWYLVRQLLNFRNALRGTTQSDAFGVAMRAAALTIPDDQGVRDVVAYINTLR
jgi:cytochrome c553